MKTIKIIGIVILLLTVTAAALGIYFFKSGGLAEPELRSLSSRWGEVNLDSTEIITRAEIYNPNPVSIPVKKLHLEVYMNGIKLASGEAENINIKAKDISQIESTTILDNPKLSEWWYTHIKNGESTEVLLKSTVYFSLLGKELTFPLEIKKEIKTDILGSASMESSSDSPVLPLGAPEVRSITHKWGEVTPEKTQVVTELKIYNPNPFPVPVKEVDYTITMNDILMALGKSSGNAELPPRSEKEITVSTYIDNKKIPQWWVSHIRNQERSVMTVKGEMIFEIAGRTLNIPLPEYRKEFSTSIMAQ